MKRIKHYNFKCPICGNEDFVKIKDVDDARVWDIEDKLEIYGCTKCHHLLFFNEMAINEALDHEEDIERLLDDIENSKKELARLEIESENLKSKLESLINDNAPSNVISENRDLLEKDILQRIKILKADIERLEAEGSGNNYLRPYNRHYDRFLACMDNITKLSKKIIELNKKLESHN